MLAHAQKRVLLNKAVTLKDMKYRFAMRKKYLIYPQTYSLLIVILYTIYDKPTIK